MELITCIKKKKHLKSIILSFQFKKKRQRNLKRVKGRGLIRRRRVTSELSEAVSSTPD